MRARLSVLSLRLFVAGRFADKSGEVEFSELLVWWRRAKTGSKKVFGELGDGMDRLQAGGGGGEGAAVAVPFKAEWALTDAGVSGVLDEEGLGALLATLGEAMDGRARHRLTGAVELKGRVPLLVSIERAAGGARHRGTGGAGAHKSLSCRPVEQWPAAARVPDHTHGSYCRRFEQANPGNVGRGGLGRERGAGQGRTGGGLVAVGETVILLTPPLHPY